VPLHLVGENIDKTRSHYQAETGKLVQLMRGIYADAGDDDIDQTVLAHAVRIARYLYPKAYLSGASAILLGPTRDGRLYLSGQRVQRTRIRALEIIQNKAPANPSVASASIADSLGEFSVQVSAVRQRFLEAFRRRSEHAMSIDPAMREALSARLIEEYGDVKGASDAIWALARENEWYREAEAAQKFLLRRPTAVAVRNEAAFDLLVAWHGRPIGTLAHDGFEWRWSANQEGARLPPVVRQTVPGKLPPFIVSLLPEGWLESVLKGRRDERALLRSGKRYMSNITVAATVDELSALPADVLTHKLAAFTRDGLFTGAYAGPGRSAVERDFEHRLAALFANAETPRLSGVQIKAPMHLDADGKLVPSVTLPFTHILKPAGTGAFEALPLIEWIGLALARACGLPTPQTALVPMPDGMPAALLVERFDIRDQPGDTRWLAMEDMCSALDLEPEQKYAGTLERVARAVRALSTAPEEDLLLLLRRVLFAWLIGDGDLHLKNLALLKIARGEGPAFSEVRLAPVYDALSTRAFPGLEHDRMALKLNGKDERLQRADFAALGSIAGLRATDAQAAIDDVLQRLRQGLDALSIPPALALKADAQATVARSLDLCGGRVAAFG
jgi:serine/threonine-protein kinase HipA